jgi:dienelactone hydrolase
MTIWTRLAVVGTVILTVLGATIHTVEGADGVRYRDEAFDGIKTTKDLVYGEAVNVKGELETLRLDVHEPAGDDAPLRAAVVWVHGGYFVEGSKENYEDAWTRFTRAGFVTFAIDYRLQIKGDFPYGAGPAVTGLQMQRYIDAITDVQHDAQAAIRWVRANAKKYRVDPDKIAIAGHSAGAITAQQVNYNDHDPGNSGNPGYSSRPNAAVSFAGTGMPLLTTRVDFLEPPLLHIHGAVDDVVPFFPFNCAVALAYLNTCEVVVDPDQDHGMFGHDFARDFLFRQMIARPTGLRPTTNVTVTGGPV